MSDMSVITVESSQLLDTYQLSLNMFCMVYCYTEALLYVFAGVVSWVLEMTEVCERRGCV